MLPFRPVLSNTLLPNFSIKKPFFHLDTSLLIGIFALSLIGQIILFSASNENIHLVLSQACHFGMACLVLLFLAQVPPQTLKRMSPILFGLALLALIAVLIAGHIGKGAQRWIHLGGIRFQPSELMKLALPLIICWYLSEHSLPPHPRHVVTCLMLLFVPVLLTAKQPDLGTALLIGAAGICVLILAGLSWRWITSGLVLILLAAPMIWYFLRPYQRGRLLTFLNPERDPLGTGYHIIQSKIAIGSGGLFGKGWLHGTQSHLAFLPEHTTDFIFAVVGEEFGFIGTLLLISLYILIIFRCVIISLQAQNPFARLLAGSLTLMFAMSAFVNIGMVCGLLPVVGLPLPLVSYGGSSVVTFYAMFGILMSIQTHKQLLSQ